jgi:hypothetical protein
VNVAFHEAVGDTIAVSPVAHPSAFSWTKRTVARTLSTVSIHHFCFYFEGYYLFSCMFMNCISRFIFYVCVCFFLLLFRGDNQQFDDDCPYKAGLPSLWSGGVSVAMASVRGRHTA